ncbi:TPA: phage major capsid protein [Escherichia coli]|nr:phage major capsid protein [Escherichia coli]
MAIDIKDVEQVAQELQQKFDDFKAKNDKRVEAIEQEKGKLAGQVETLNGKLSELENLKSDLEKELLELKRPAGGAQNKLATEHKEAFVGFLRKGREDGLRDLERKALQVTEIRVGPPDAYLPEPEDPGARKKKKARVQEDPF